MIVRRERPGDRDAVAAVHRAAFAVPGNDDPDEPRVLDALRADGALVPALSLVALAGGTAGGDTVVGDTVVGDTVVGDTVVGDTVVGHVACSRGDLAGRPVPGLGPLGVRPDAQRRGVGSALVHAVLGAADALGEPAVAVLGDPAYYGRFGFVPAADLGVLAPDPGWGGYFQIRTLEAWDPALRGGYRYAAAFDRF